MPLSHDEVVHGKASLLNKMPGGYEEKFAHLRAFLGYQMAHPGKKLLFMGGEFAQFIEWDYQKELDWMLLDYEYHEKFYKYVCDLNKFYLANSTLWEIDNDWSGFSWIVADDNTQNVAAFMRLNEKGEELICVSNFSPVTRENYTFGVPKSGKYVQLFSSDSKKYGGKGIRNKTVSAKEEQSHGYKYSISVTVPPLSMTFFGRMKKAETKNKEEEKC